MEEKNKQLKKDVLSKHTDRLREVNRSVFFLAQ